MDHRVRVVEHDIAPRDILQRSQHLSLHFCTGKNVKGGHGA